MIRDTPGHSDSQLTLHLPEPGRLVAADMLSDIEIPFLAGPPAVYRASSRRCSRCSSRRTIETLVPGTAAVARGRAPATGALLRDLDYLVRSKTASPPHAKAGDSLDDDAVASWRQMDYSGKNAGNR